MLQSAEDFGLLVKSKRLEQQLTQAELAWRAGTGERFVVELENGKETCQLGKALTVARALGIELVNYRDIDVPSQPDADDDLSYVPDF